MNTHHPALTHLYPADFEAGQATSGTPLPQDLVLELFDNVEEGLAITGCDHSFRCSEAFLVANGVALRSALAWLRRNGASCDCESLEEFEQHLHVAEDVC